MTRAPSPSRQAVAAALGGIAIAAAVGVGGARAEASPGAPIVSPGAPGVSPGAPIVSPGAPSVSPGAPGVSPGAPIVSPGAPGVSPGAPGVSPPMLPVAAKAPADPPPRPPPLPPLETKPLAWERHLEIGGDLVLGSRPSSHDATGAASGVAYLPAIGFGLHARWQVWKYLRFAAYFADLHHGLRVPTGSLGLPGASYDLDVAKTMVFGARIAPTLPFGERGRAWVSIGAGWGRFEFARAKVTLPGEADTSTLHEQAFSFVEFPIGLGASYDLVPRWLSFEVELTGGVFTGQRGEALDGRQIIDGSGHVRHTTGLPVVDASFTQTVGLSLLL